MVLPRDPNMMPPQDPMMMGPGVAPMGPMPADPMMGAMGPAQMQDPMMAQPMQQPMAPPPMEEPQPTLDLEEMDDLDPIYPSWLVDRRTRKPKPPKEPSASYCRDAVAADEMENHSLLDRFRNDLRIYRKHEESMFEDLDPDDVELYTSAEPALQVDKIANMVSGIDNVITFPWKNPEEETMAQTLENFSYYFLGEIDKHHRAGGNAAYKWDATWYRAVYGRIVTRVLPDPEDPDFPWDVRLYDPATVFPVFGTKRGISRVSCVYSETLDKVLQTYGDNPKVKKDLLTKFQNQENGSVPLNRTGVIKEYWDAWYRWAEYDGIEILPVTAHELGRIPFIYTMGTGEAGSATLPKAEKLTIREMQSGLSLGANAGDPNRVNKGLSFFHHMMPALRQEAAIYSVLMTSAKQSLAPPVAIESPYEDPPEPIEMATGRTNKLRPGEKLQPLLSGARPTDIGPIVQNLREQRTKAGLPDQMFGALEGSNISGFAVESLIAAAKDRIQPVIDDLEHHIADVIDMALYQYRNFGHLYVEEFDGSYPIPMQGKQVVVSQKKAPNRPQSQQIMQLLMGMSRGMPTDFTAAWDGQSFDNSTVPDGEHEDQRMTRDMILRIGTRPEVKLHTVQLQNMTQLANVVNMLIESKVWSRTRAMEELNVKNPQQEWGRILQEDAQTNPKMLELVMFPQALWESGNVSAFISYFATVVMPQLQGLMQPPPIDGGGQQAPEGAQTAQGASQPQMGASPGRPADGGAPMM